MNYLLGRQVDVSYVVRMICIQGLGNMADIKGSQVRGMADVHGTPLEHVQKERCLVLGDMKPGVNPALPSIFHPPILSSLLGVQVLHHHPVRPHGWDG